MPFRDDQDAQDRADAQVAQQHVAISSPRQRQADECESENRRVEEQSAAGTEYQRGQSIRERSGPKSAGWHALAARRSRLREKLDSKRCAEVGGVVPQLKQKRRGRGCDERPNLA